MARKVKAEPILGLRADGFFRDALVLESRISWMRAGQTSMPEPDRRKRRNHSARAHGKPLGLRLDAILRAEPPTALASAISFWSSYRHNYGQGHPQHGLA